MPFLYKRDICLPSMGHHTSEQIDEKLETVFQSYYSHLWMDRISIGLYDVIQESVEKETGKLYLI